MDRILKVTDKILNVTGKSKRMTDSGSKVANILGDDRLLFLLEMYCYDKVEGSRRQRRRIIL